jgi:hypothetical protein
MLAECILGTLLAYATCGLLFGVAFVTVGVARVDAAAVGTSFVFRLLILPGVIALWPWLAVQWVKARNRGGRA